jgi:hypothetical protein
MQKRQTCRGSLSETYNKDSCVLLRSLLSRA